MKTQILNLRSGTKNQILNAQIDYSKLPAASSHAGHSGSNSKEVKKIWEQVTAENPENLKIKIKGVEIVLTANWSKSRKSVNYYGSLTKKDLEDKFCLKSAQSENPYISIQNANIIIISNGKKNTSYVCPSLIEIL
jgi:hypothetical protein